MQTIYYLKTLVSLTLMTQEPNLIGSAIWSPSWHFYVRRQNMFGIRIWRRKKAKNSLRISVVKPNAQWDCRLAFCEAKRMFPLSYGVPRTFYKKTIPESPYEYLSDLTLCARKSTKLLSCPPTTSRCTLLTS